VKNFIFQKKKFSINTLPHSLFAHSHENKIKAACEDESQEKLRHAKRQELHPDGRSPRQYK